MCISNTYITLRLHFQTFTSKSEEYREYQSNESRTNDTKPKDSDQPSAKQPEHSQKSQEQRSPKRNKREKFSRSTHRKPGDHSPYCEDTYYSKTDESDDATPTSRTHKKVHVVRESHVQVMSDKKSEVYKSSTVSPAQRVPEEKQFHSNVRDVHITRVSTPPISKVTLAESNLPTTDNKTTEIVFPNITLKSTDLVKLVQEIPSKCEKELEPFPFEVKPDKPQRAKVPPPPKPRKFIKGDFTESDYDSDFDMKLRPKWHPDDEGGVVDPNYSSVKPTLKYKEKAPRDRTPTPPTQFDNPPTFDGPPRPKVEFPESESEYERPPSPVVTEKIKPRKIKLSKLQPSVISPIMREASPKEKLPELKPEPVAEEGYIPPPAPSQYTSNAVGVESTKITTISDTNEHHKRFITEQHTTRIFKLSDVKPVFAEQKAKEPTVAKSTSSASQEQECFPPEDLPFTPIPRKPRKEKPTPPPLKPRKFLKGEFHESDYESDADSRIKPKWQPPDSDADEPTYNKVRAPRSIDRSTSRTRERSPTPPSVFEIPSASSEPLRPTVEKIQKPHDITVPKGEKQFLHTVAPTVEDIVDGAPLPPRGPTPVEGVIVPTTEYVIDNVKVEIRPTPPETIEVPTYHKKPYTEIVEKTEKIFKKKQMKEEVSVQKSKNEKITKKVFEYRDIKPDEQHKADLQTEELAKPSDQFTEVVKKPNQLQKKDIFKPDPAEDYDNKSKPLWPRTKAESCIKSHQMLKSPSIVEVDCKISVPTTDQPKQWSAPQKGTIYASVDPLEGIVSLDPSIPDAQTALKISLLKPEPEPEYGYVNGFSEKPSDKFPIEHKFRVTLDGDGDYYPLTESDADYTDSDFYKSGPESNTTKRPMPRSSLMPSKFLKGAFSEDEPLQDDKQEPIPSLWYPPDSECDEPVYRHVVPPSTTSHSHHLPRDKTPSPPSKFDKPPSFEGPPRPIMEKYTLHQIERRESLEDYSLPKFPKVEFKESLLDKEPAPQNLIEIPTLKKMKPSEKYATTEQRK